MSIRIDKNKCISCGNCVSICPGNLIYQDAQNKAFIKYPKDCWGCTACLKECQVSAVNMYLDEDINGKGGYLFTTKENEELHWHIIDKSGKEQIIKVSRKESNKY